MSNLSGIPYLPVEFKKDGSINDPADVGRAVALVSDATATDLFVISHGWNNDMADAENLYDRFFEQVRAVLDSGVLPNLASRKFAILGVLWPSKKFADEDLIPSGAAGAADPVSDAALVKQLQDLKGGFDHPDGDKILTDLQGLVPKLNDSPAAQKEFIEKLRSLPGRKEQEATEGSDLFFTKPAGDIMKELSKPSLPSGRAGGGAGGAAALGPGGGAAGLGDLLSGIKNGARNAANLTTYYQMKERAGTVGKGGVYSLLAQVRASRPSLKMHLIGHSFGGRLVTAVADGPAGQPPIVPSSMTLLQAAFSHFGFAEKWDKKNDGFFRNVLAQNKVAGPILVTHSDKDSAVGKAYAIASRLAGQVAAGLGDEHDKYGGIGRNGALMTPEAVNGPLLNGLTNGPYTFAPGKIYNLRANGIIMGHSDITKPQTALAVLSAVAST